MIKLTRLNGSSGLMPDQSQSIPINPNQSQSISTALTPDRGLKLRLSRRAFLAGGANSKLINLSASWKCREWEEFSTLNTQEGFIQKARWTEFHFELSLFFSQLIFGTATAYVHVCFLLRIPEFAYSFGALANGTDVFAGHVDAIRLDFLNSASPSLSHDSPFFCYFLNTCWVSAVPFIFLMLANKSTITTHTPHLMYAMLTDTSASTRCTYRPYLAMLTDTSASTFRTSGPFDLVDTYASPFALLAVCLSPVMLTKA